MRTVDDEPLETIHLYVMREEAARPSFLPVFLALLALSTLLVLCTLSPSQQPEERLAIRIPAVFLPIQTFSASVPIIPTGIKVYPATTAHGILTIANGSIISETLPKGMVVDTVVLDDSVFVPAGSANGYGYTTVSAHALTSGKHGNIPAYGIDSVENASIYIRNLRAFTGGYDAYSVTFITSNDRDKATSKARALIASKIAHIPAFLTSPCKENLLGANNKMVISWRCQFAVYHIPSYMHVLGAKLAGRDFLVTVEFIPRPRRFWAK